jgi:hypothetical protein
MTCDAIHVATKQAPCNRREQHWITRRSLLVDNCREASGVMLILVPNPMSDAMQTYCNGIGMLD